MEIESAERCVWHHRKAAACQEIHSNRHSHHTLNIFEEGKNLPHLCACRFWLNQRSISEVAPATDLESVSEFAPASPGCLSMMMRGWLIAVERKKVFDYRKNRKIDFPRRSPDAHLDEMPAGVLPTQADRRAAHDETASSRESVLEHRTPILKGEEKKSINFWRFVGEISR